jgi:hypothetical protein
MMAKAFDGAAFGREIVELVKGYVARELATRDARIAELEARPSLHDAGVWTETETYVAGSVVSHQGSAWCAQIASTGVRPGSGDGCWRLLVKKGRDARDSTR